MQRRVPHDGRAQLLGDEPDRQHRVPRCLDVGRHAVVLSMGIRLPFPMAYALPIVSTRVFVPRTMVTLWVLGFHSIVPPRASMMGARGTNVRSHLIWGSCPFCP